jgi:outer membrane protein assembly factor BamA
MVNAGNRGEVSLRALAAGMMLALLVVPGPFAPCADALQRSYIPLPEILTDPNEGNTYGALAVVLFLDDHKIIKYILAPDVRYNKIAGVFPAFRLFGFPTLDKKWSIVLRKSQHIDEDYEFIYQDNAFWQDRLRLSADLEYERDSTERFFGFGNGSSEHDESNYTAQQGVGLVRLNYRLQPTLELTYQSRVRVFRVRQGGVDRLPFIGDEHPGTPGLGGATMVGQEIGLVYDNRDDTNIPRQGGFGLFSAEFIPRLLGSSFTAIKYAAEIRKFIPLHERFVLAMHSRINYLQSSDDVPFFEQNDVGGRRSLRGFGSNRFVDRNSFFASAELRTRVYDRQIFGVNAELELAPFFDFGQVFKSSRSSPFNDLHAVGGLGFRGVVRPQVVGFVDIGLGEQGAAVFTGLEYPF